MRMQSCGALMSFFILTTGCATGPLPGSAGQVQGPLRSIELYTRQPEWNEVYATLARGPIFASDKAVHVLLRWGLPGPGNYSSKIVVRTPAGSVHRESALNFRAEGASWRTRQRIELPQGDAAKPLGGRWEVQVALDGTPVGRRDFLFEPSSIRLRTDARLVIVQGYADPDLAPGDWVWRDQFTKHESARTALATVGLVLRDELARRFPQVDGPRSGPEVGDGTVLLRSSVGVSPNPDTDARLELEVVHLPTKATRKFVFKTSAGVEGAGRSKVKYHDVAAADLGFQAASSPEVLEFLTTVTQAVSE